MIFISDSLEQTEKISKDFLEKINFNLHTNAFVVGLYGDLGSGKTTFVQRFAKNLGVKEFVTSPTFVIEKVYDIEHKDFDKLVHIDAYRLDSANELLTLGWEKLFENPKNLILIEWPEKVKEILPENHAKVKFRFLSENEREIEI